MSVGPDPSCLHPLAFSEQVAFLQPLAEGRENVEIGRFAYYDDPDGPEGFFDRCVRYHFPFHGDRLVIGAFCAIGARAQFIMNGANHGMTGLSTYPFAIFGHGWDDGFDFESFFENARGDTVIGPDVWIGTEAMILPGVTIGAGAVIGARAVVGRDVAPYAVVAGNPAREIRQRFTPDIVSRLLAVAWWDWPAERITRALPAIRAGDIEMLETMA
ncbi:CatB-related O-acetyltransferase [Palleronia sediminis]|uniref:CatB-related O-acetyltransferase n=1 Tax=Palleronia sediminis TaxID=2547833 RepID=A0A4V3B921_9RHOB|nr:CatB-related O-acetyltransferase [Palleronia sediminis]TDL77679.1 CatB-related O-acetyltransferase [Palleronia sediminis]